MWANLNKFNYMNKLIIPFFICYLLSFDAMVRNPIAGYIVFIGSTAGLTTILWNIDYGKKSK